MAPKSIHHLGHGSPARSPTGSVSGKSIGRRKFRAGRSFRNSRSGRFRESRSVRLQLAGCSLPGWSGSHGRSRATAEDRRGNSGRIATQARKPYQFRKLCRKATADSSAGARSHPLRTQQLRLREHGLHGFLLQVGRITCRFRMRMLQFRGHGWGREHLVFSCFGFRSPRVSGSRGRCGGAGGCRTLRRIRRWRCGPGPG